MKFGDYLRRKREEFGWTQPEAAARAEIEQSYLSKLETGRSYPSEDVYARLVDVYEISTADLVDQVDAPELDRLREVQAVRSEVLGRSRKETKLARGWMLAGVAGLVLGGASIGGALTAQHDEYVEYQYRSQGVLGLTEELNAFQYANRRYEDVDGAQDEAERVRIEAHNARLEDILSRLDPQVLTLRESRGDAFIVEEVEGRRYFRLTEDRLHSIPSPLRWLIVPGLAFLLGSLGCFFASFRWRT